MILIGNCSGFVISFPEDTINQDYCVVSRNNICDSSTRTGWVRGGEMGQLPKRRSLRLVCSKALQRRDVHSMWEKSEAFMSTPIPAFTRPQSPRSKPISAIHLPLLALPDFIGSHYKSTHHKYDLWRGFKNGALLPKRRAGPSAVTARTQEKACFSRSVYACVIYGRHGAALGWPMSSAELEPVEPRRASWCLLNLNA